jgi:Leucine-rich repeat (LRR) protein
MVQGNHLTSLQGIGSVSASLYRLDVSGNEISSLLELSSCTKLTELNANCNPLAAQLDGSCFAALLLLRRLNLSGCHLQHCFSLPPMIHLTSLLLQDNQITKVHQITQVHQTTQVHCCKTIRSLRYIAARQSDRSGALLQDTSDHS